MAWKCGETECSGGNYGSGGGRSHEPVGWMQELINLPILATFFKY